MTSLSSTTDLLGRARQVVMGGGQGHKRPSDIPGYPAFAVRGKGCRFWDNEGREFIDYLCAFGPILLGYAHPAVDEAVRKQIDEGVIFNVPHPSEAELAERLIGLIPCAEMVAYFTGGSGATSGAVKVARAYTKREKVVRCGYHGWHDWCCPGGEGVPRCVSELTLELPYNDVDALQAIFQEHGPQIACVIIEPVIGSGPRPGFLEAVKSVCDEHGAILIFDEVKTGFRFAMGGAQEYLGITPDLSTFGKAMANGYDIGVLVGKKEKRAPEYGWPRRFTDTCSESPPQRQLLTRWKGSTGSSSSGNTDASSLTASTKSHAGTVSKPHAPDILPCPFSASRSPRKRSDADFGKVRRNAASTSAPGTHGSYHPPTTTP